MARYSVDVLSFDDLIVGDEWESQGRTVTETDVVLFAGLSGDYNPLHCNHEISKSGTVWTPRCPRDFGPCHRNRLEQPCA